MIHLGNHDATQTARLIRDELAAAREHLRAAAEQGSQRAAHSSHRARRMAGRQAGAAVRTLRGHRLGAPWRWLGIGLGAGVIVGVAGAAVVRRIRATAPEDEAPTPAVAALRDRGAAVANRATHTARQTVARARQAARRGTTGDGSDPSSGPDGARPLLDPDPEATSE